MLESTAGHILSLKHRDVYHWKNGAWLQALQDVELMFPGILVQGSEKFGSVMEVSDSKTQVGFVKNRNGEGFESINIRRKLNASLRLFKDTETAITFNSASPALFRILSASAVTMQ